MSTPIESLYVHVPFCRNICGYCDFYKLPLKVELAGATVDALLAELRRLADDHPLALRTVFVGGGTPTELPMSELERLVCACGAHRARSSPSGLRASAPSCLDSWEFTLEANPATITAENAQMLAAAGVNRISMGAQSFNSDELRFLDRKHRPGQIAESVAICREAGIAALNLDLIFGIPGQTRDTWRASMRSALDLDVEHLSCYALTYEHGTTLYRRLQTGRVLQMDNDLEADLYEFTMDYLEAAGLRQYEISNYARPGFECRHNVVYWHNQPCAAIGPSACGFVDGLRYKNVPDLKQYLDLVQAGRRPRVLEERLDARASARETAMLALRLNAGLDRAAFHQRFGIDAAVLFESALRSHVNSGLVEVHEHDIRLTRAGRLVADSVFVDLM
jgi:oxygen-independent coproporphyrinogen-3 oxidase